MVANERARLRRAGMAFDGQRPAAIRLEVGAGRLRLEGASGTIAFEGQHVQRRWDRLLNYWRLLSHHPVRIAYDRVLVIQDRSGVKKLKVDPGWPYEDAIVIEVEGNIQDVLDSWHGKPAS